MRRPPIGSLTVAGLWTHHVGERPYRVTVREEGEPGSNVLLDYQNERRRMKRSLGFPVRTPRGRFDAGEVREAEQAALDLWATLRLGCWTERPDDAPVLAPIDRGAIGGAERAAAVRRVKGNGKEHRSCAVCGWWVPRIGRIPYPGLQVHHLVPLNVGGTNHSSNLILLCANCHAIAHALWGMRPGPGIRGEFIVAVEAVLVAGKQMRKGREP